MRHWIDLDGNLVLQILIDHSGLAYDALCKQLGI
jgi:hypothetical protein